MKWKLFKHWLEWKIVKHEESIVLVVIILFIFSMLLLLNTPVSS